MPEQDTEGYLDIKDYVDAIRSLGGQADTLAISNEVGREKATVTRMFNKRDKRIEKNGDVEVEVFEEHPVRRKELGGSHIYEIDNERDTEQEDGDE
jgi:hypothetical protein